MAVTKLMPPILGSRLPANTGNFIYVYFNNNRAVDLSGVEAICLKLRTIQGDQDPLGKGLFNSEEMVLNSSNPYAKFSLTNNNGKKLNVGQYYKIQIAQVQTGTHTVGYFSEVGIMKYTSEPSLDLNVSTDSAHPTAHSYNYIGAYYQHALTAGEEEEYYDYSEKVQSYRFTLGSGLSDDNIYDTGWLIHNSSYDSANNESNDEFNYFNLLPINTVCTLKYWVRTTNGLERSISGQISNDATDTDVWHCNVDLDQDNAYATINFDGSVPSGITKVNLVRYVIEYDDEMVATYKDGIGLKSYNSEDLPATFYDHTIEQGVRYLYRWVGSANDEVYQSPAEDNAIIRADFEDIFLSETVSEDGRPIQLKIRFNPNINQIHETLQEAKVDTLGGKYPYFFRNGEKRYRDFTISGVISFQGDEQNLFSNLYGKPAQPTRERTQTTLPQDTEPAIELMEQGFTSSDSDYTVGNYFRERKFREEVYAYLTNGNPKLFRSAPEGNVLVRILNVNLTPFNGTSRMVYQLSCQAYECDGTDYASLVRNNIVEEVL